MAALKEFSHHASRFTPFFDTLWVLALAIYILAGTPLTPFHGDESTLIFMSRDYAYQFIERDWGRVRYSESPDNPAEQRLRLLNGTLAKYGIGLAWDLGGFSIEDVNEQWDWSADWDYNQQNGHAPGDDLLKAARWPSAIFLAGGAAVMFALGQVLGGRGVAYVASLYYALNPALLINGRRAMMEGGFLFFSLLVVLAGLWLWRKQSWAAALGLGLAAGLALATKHTAVVVVAAVFGVYGLQPIIKGRSFRGLTDDKRRLRLSASALVLGVVIFLALNPVWWGNPFSRAFEVLELRQDLLDTQVTVFGGYDGSLDALGGFWRQVLRVRPQYYEAPNWAENISGEIEQYEASVWRGVSVGGTSIGALLIAGIVILGALTLARDKQIGEQRWLFWGWWLAVLLFTLLLTPLEWQRYYLATHPVVGLLFALGVVRLVGLVKNQLWLNKDGHAGALPSPPHKGSMIF